MKTKVADRHTIMKTMKACSRSGLLHGFYHAMKFTKRGRETSMDCNSQNTIKQFFDHMADTWDEENWIDANKIAAIVTLAGIREGSRVVDIACGTGVLVPELLSRNPSLLLGVDLSDRMIERAREKYTDPRLRLLATDLFAVKETGFDTAMIFNAYPHFGDKRDLAAQAAKLLASGGRLMVAHGGGKQIINSCHTGEAVSHISWPLRSASEEAAEFSEFFEIDMTVDSPDIYLFSGIKKEA